MRDKRSSGKINVAMGSPRRKKRTIAGVNMDIVRGIFGDYGTGLMSTQLSLVFCYGEKTDEFCELISSAQKLISAGFGTSFIPYSIEQIHGTMISLERLNDRGYINKNFALLRNIRCEMDFDGLIDYFKNTKIFPLRIQVGGFKNKDYGFLSRDLTPYDRSFSIQGKLATMLGWPFLVNQTANSSRDFELSTALGKLRKDLESFNILHGYHAIESIFDNDFYFRVGIIDGSLIPSEDMIAVEEQMRGFLSNRPPLTLSLGPENIFLVFYKDQSLPYESSRFWSITHREVNSDFIKTHYQQS